MQCESHGIPDRIGDGHLTYWKNGVEYGKSYGLFQYRHLPGRKIFTDPEENIKLAAALFKANKNRFGTLSGWYNCAKIVGVS